MKLYALMVAKDANEWLRPIAYSHDIDKLQELAPTVSGWTVGQRDSRVVRRSDEEVFPAYVIKEVPFVC